MVAAMDPRSSVGTANKPYSDRGYTMEEAIIVDKAKKTHRETTESAQRAAKVSYVRFSAVNHYLRLTFLTRMSERFR